MSSTYPTSLSPDVDHKVWLEQLTRYVVPASHPMLAEKLAARQMTTGMFAANRLLDQPAGVLRGFQHEHVYGSMRPERRSIFAQLPFLQDMLYRCTSGIVTEHPVDTSKVVTRSALTFLNRYGGQRFYLWLHYMDPHSPYDPPMEYRSEKGPWPLFAPTDPHWGTPQLPKYQSRLDLPEDEKHYVQSLYEGEMAYVDAHVGRVLDYLDAHSLLDNTYVCLTSDHGEEFWDHGLFFHGQSVYNELIHVPLVISGPGIAAGRRRGEVMSAIDLMPTLAGLMGEPVPAEWRGHSWADALLKGSPPPSTPAFAQGTGESASEPMRTVVRNTDKLVVRMESGSTELYDLKDDPEEQHDLSAITPRKAADLSNILTEWSASFRSVFSTEGETGAIDAEILERMNAVGYLD